MSSILKSIITALSSSRLEKHEKLLVLNKIDTRY
jgi:hypothetical protein